MEGKLDALLMMLGQKAGSRTDVLTRNSPIGGNCPVSMNDQVQTQNEVLTVVRAKFPEARSLATTMTSPNASPGLSLVHLSSRSLTVKRPPGFVRGRGKNLRWVYSPGNSKESNINLSPLGKPSSGDS